MKKLSWIKILDWALFGCIVIFLMIVCTIVLTACTTTPIPVSYNCPKLELPSDPPQAIRLLNSKSKPDEVMKAWVATATDYYQWNQIVHAEVDSLN